MTQFRTWAWTIYISKVSAKKDDAGCRLTIVKKQQKNVTAWAWTSQKYQLNRITPDED